RSARTGPNASAPPPSPGPIDTPAQGRRPQASPRRGSDRTDGLRAMLAEQGQTPLDQRAGTVDRGPARRPSVDADRIDRAPLRDGAPGARANPGRSADPGWSADPGPSDDPG